MLTSAFVPSDLPMFDIQGHRGCRGLMPENTVPAFLKALELGVTTLEMDVVISKDRQVVVSHEPYFNAAFSIAPDGVPVDKKAQKNLVLYTMTYADIKRYDVGTNGNPAYPEQKKLSIHKPLLSEVLEQAEAYRKAHNLPLFSYNIEIKSEPSEYGKSQPEPTEFCELVQAVLKKQFPAERVNSNRIIIQSFDFAMLKQWKKGVAESDYPPVRLSALVENLRSPSTNLDELGFTPDIYSPYFRLLSKRKINWLHEQNIRVIPWTVNNRADMERLKRWGVDGLITDYPDRASGL
ncbi:glycerophosphodiester phosphodiesterase family protein [Spirosoma sp.]|uniref:glycerophosphodiester phosphodiesterase family protein n=1 Tax=Spirosoma sp. TaxID=1899569 RepID=UPI0026313F47|nr:glycerophosphodiester phosphodiesterase family protein [Spirosoma sp.]MCX6213456.1 glycerophosphodiester phosphodiesterase family protein [Spirosoma sp.]